MTTTKIERLSEKLKDLLEWCYYSKSRRKRVNKLERITSTLEGLLKSSSFQFGGALTVKVGDTVFIIRITENVPTLNVYQANKS